MRKIGKIEFYLIKIVQAHPSIVHFVRQLRFTIWIFLIKLRRYNNVIVNKIIWVDPKKIEYVSLELDPILNMGKVIGGNWDKLLNKFDDTDVYESFKKRYIDKEEWESNSFYNNIINELEKGKILLGCADKKEIDERFKKIDILYNEIKLHGYKLNKQVKHKYHKFYDPYIKEAEVTVNIGRNGDFLFNDGRCRLAIAKILNIQKIPVKVIARHTEWMKLRKELIEFAKRSNGILYQPLTHPDLQDFPSQYDSYRYDIIKENMSLKKGTILDIGAQLGYFCFRFEEDGYDCYAVEYDPLCIYFLNKFKTVNKGCFKIIETSIFEYNKDSDISFDIVLALNLFHHFLKTKESYNDLIKLLKRIKAKELFLQSHNTDEPQMRGAYKNYTPEEFAQFISNCTNLRYKLIGETKDHRKIFKFSNGN